MDRNGFLFCSGRLPAAPWLFECEMRGKSDLRAISYLCDPCNARCSSRFSLHSCPFVSIRGYYFFFGIVWNDGIDSSMTTHGNLSSRKIALCGANAIGSSRDAIVKSIVSESSLSSKNK